MGDHLGTPGTVDKNQSLAPLREHVSKADGRHISVQALGKSGLCSGQFAGDHCKSGPPEYWPLVQLCVESEGGQNLLSLDKRKGT